MSSLTSRLAAGIVALTLVLSNTACNTAFACGPFFDSANFSYDVNPDLPLKSYANGHLGIVLPTFAKSYLVVAYRFFEGKPLSQSQQKSFLSLIYKRLGQTTAEQKVGGADVWVKAHNKITSLKALTYISQSRQVNKGPDGPNDFYLNCPDESFDNASQTLQVKIAKHGITSAFVKDWTNAQDQVFCHCGGTEYDWKTKVFAPEPGFPVLRGDEHDSEAKADRAYQIAAAHFYAQKFDQAFKEYSAIASDSTSSYAPLARYMTARCLIRKANLISMDTKVRTSILESALQILKDIADDKSAQFLAYHSSCAKLTSFINCIINPDVQLHQIAIQLNATSDDDNFLQKLDDYTVLLNQAEGYSDDDYYDPSSAKSTLPKTFKDDDLTEWLTVFQMGQVLGKEAAFNLSIENYRKSHSAAWLIASLYHAPSDKMKCAELLTAVRALSSNSPAYLTANYEAAKLMITMKEFDEVESVLKNILNSAKAEKLPSAVNLIMDLRSKLPMNLEQFVINSVRSPASYSVFFDYFDQETSNKKPSVQKPVAPAFADSNASFMNNSMPISMLTQMCTNDKIPLPLKENLVEAVWTRALMLNDQQSLAKATATLMDLTSRLKYLNSMKPLLQRTLNTNANERNFSAAYLLLKFPGMRPYVTGGAARQETVNLLDDFNDNWWSDSQTSTDDSSSFALSKKDLKGLPNFPNLVNASQSALALRENKQLKALGAGPSYLGAIVCAYGSANKSDPRVPESLALLVRASHYGIKDKVTSKYSKQAFELLHKNYPGNPYTKKTPYHY